MSASVLAVKFPLKINDDYGGFVTYSLSELKQVVEQNLKMVLLTNPGEKIFNLEFGVGLRRYLFLREDEVLNGVPGDDRYPPLRQYIDSQIQTYIPYITVENMNITTKESTINVRFRYYINNSSIAEEFDLTIDDVR